MKYKLVLLVFLMCLINSLSNAQIGIGTTSPNASAALDISSTSKGILFPRLTTIQRANIANPTAGMVIYCTNCGANGELQIYNGTAWLNPATNTAAAAIPILTTTAINNISIVTANSGGTIVDEGSSSVTTKGVCWNTTANPTIANTKTIHITATSSFSSTITSLNANTTYYVRAYATSASGTGYGDQLTFTTLPPQVASFATSTSSAITAYAATINSTISADNGATVTSRGVCWSTNTNPTTANNTQTNGSGTGSYSNNITGLSPNTTYYVRSYAINSAGTGYSSQISFTTADIPTLTTMDISNISKFAASSGGYIDDEGTSSVTAKGVCWSTTTNPTTANSKTSNGTGAATYSSSITSLNVSTTYYVRAYATNSFGTGYGDQLTFTTLPPEVASFDPTTTSAITGYSATISSNITSNNGATVTSRGVCYSLTQSPTTANNPQTSGSGNGAYDITLSGLLADTIYYVRSYAINSVGTGYSAQISFRTGIRSLPTLTTTTAISTITATTAVSGGNVTSSGNDLLTAKGICWSTSSIPSNQDISLLSTKTSNGTATGTYVSSLTGLTPSTLYYVRAYATNSVGTVYGNELSFTTSATLAGSLSFNGTNQYLSLTGTSPGLTFGTGNTAAGAFTVEGWIYNTGTLTADGIIGWPDNAPANTGAMFFGFLDNKQVVTTINTTNSGADTRTYVFTNAITANAWHYLIYNRNADGKTAVFVDGVRSTMLQDNINYYGASTWIGRNYHGPWPGYITNLKVTIGEALYNSNSTATIPNPIAPLTASASGTTKLLLLGNSATTDAAGVQTTITNNNGVSTSTTIKPF